MKIDDYGNLFHSSGDSRRRIELFTHDTPPIDYFVDSNLINVCRHVVKFPDYLPPYALINGDIQLFLGCSGSGNSILGKYAQVYLAHLGHTSFTERAYYGRTWDVIAGGLRIGVECGDVNRPYEISTLLISGEMDTVFILPYQDPRFMIKNELRFYAFSACGKM